MENYRKRVADVLLANKLAGKGAVLIEGPKRRFCLSSKGRWRDCLPDCGIEAVNAVSVAFTPIAFPRKKLSR